MKYLALSLLLFSSLAQASSEEIAFERLAYELGSAKSPDDHSQSIDSYLVTLDRIGATATNLSGCHSSLLFKAKLAACAPMARSGGGTGGVD